MTKKKGEPQYQSAIELIRGLGLQQLGFMSSWAFYDDPKRLAFTFSRYKFVAKMLENFDTALEIGCSDAFATRIVAQSVENVIAIDFDPSFIQSAKAIMSPRWPIDIRLHNIMDGPVDCMVDAAYSLDVLEHISVENEDIFIRNILASLTRPGVAIFGMPSLQSQGYASAHSKEGHVNCKDQRDFKAMMRVYFDSVFMFSMNDEVIHTGYHAMSHYNFALCCGVKV
jgi:cyclopropane fatty-acyl-phospholipid synthase-like methyltransferase